MKKILVILTTIVVLSLIGCQPKEVKKISGEDIGLTSDEDIDTQDIEADIADINLEEDLDLSELESLEQDLEDLI